MEIFQKYEKQCPNCEEHYTAKRINQVYCSALCKTRFNNHKSQQYNQVQFLITSEINKILWRNRNLLEKYLDETISIEQMKSEGFEMSHITNFTIDIQQQNIFIIYDLAYQFLDAATIKIFKL